MSALDLLARAEVSGDLRHYEHRCDVDVLGAAGLAAIKHPGHMSLFRVKILNDAAELAAAKSLFIRWARVSMTNRMRAGSTLNPEKASRVGVQALSAWLNDVCGKCKGVKFVVKDGTPYLSDKQCPHCQGTGREPIRQRGEMLEVYRELHERADTAIGWIQVGLKNKLR